MLDTTGTAVKAARQRARATLRRPVARPAPLSAGERALVRRFAEAFTADDIDGVVALLTDDAWLTMPPAPHEYQGGAAIGGFLRASAAWHGSRRFRLVATRANTQPAFGCYLPVGAVWQPAGLLVLSLAGDRIAALTRFFAADLFPRFSLPRVLDDRAVPSTVDGTK